MFTVRRSASPSPAMMARLRRRLADVEQCLYLQLYYWGRDVIHPGGNQLVAYGFERLAKQTLEGTSRYQIPLQDGRIELHGWCLGWYRPDAPGFVYVRGRQRLFLWDHPHPARPDRLSSEPLRAPRKPADWRHLAQAVQCFCRWLLEYEQWNAAIHPDGFRKVQFREYQQLPNAMRWLPPDLQQQWLHQFVEDPFSAPAARRFLKDQQPRSRPQPPCCQPHYLPHPSLSHPARLRFI